MDRDRRLVLDAAALTSLAVATAFLRVIAFPQAVIDWDESVYQLMARSVLQGHLPYTAIWDHKPPGIYLAFAAAQLVFGQTLVSMRVLALLAVTLTSFLLYFYGRDAMRSRSTGWLAGFFYAVFSQQNGGLATHTEIVMMPLIVGAFYLLAVRAGVPAAIRLDRRGAFYGIGLLLGAAIQIKLLAAFETLAAGLMIVAALFLVRRQQSPLSLRQATAVIGVFVLGVVAPAVLVMMWFAVGGVFDEYIYANFTANFEYVRQAEISFSHVVRSLGGQVRSAMVLWVGPILAILVVWFARPRRPRTVLDFALVGTWFLFALLGALSTRRLFHHYFLEVIPPLCLIAGYAIVRTAQADTRLSKPAQAALLAGALLLALARPLAGPLRWNAAEIVTLMKGTPRVDVSVYIAGYLRERMNTDDTLYVADGQPILYYLTDTRIPTRYVQPAQLNRPEIAAITGMDPLLELDSIMRHEPKYVVVDEDYGQDPAFYDRLLGYLERSYVLERTIKQVQLFRRLD